MTSLWQLRQISYMGASLLDWPVKLAFNLQAMVPIGCKNVRLLLKKKRCVA